MKGCLLTTRTDADLGGLPSRCASVDTLRLACQPSNLGASTRKGREYAEACEGYYLAPTIIFTSMTFLAASIAGSSVSRRVDVPFSLRNCWMNESS